MPGAPGTLEMEFDGRAPAGENRISMAFDAREGAHRHRGPGLRVRVQE